MKERIVLLGGGGHCKVVIDAIISGGKYDIVGIIDPNIRPGEEVLGVQVLGNEDMLQGLAEKGVKCAFISVGSVGDCSTRKKIYEKIKDDFSIPSIIHPRAVIGREVKIGEGTFIAASA
ncbi:MAG: serine acetyltransferase, partial [Candidatus Omnitrophota bacterium]